MALLIAIDKTHSSGFKPHRLKLLAANSGATGIQPAIREKWQRKAGLPTTGTRIFPTPAEGKNIGIIAKYVYKSKQKSFIIKGC